MDDTHPRLRFAEFRMDRLPSGRCRATVVLTQGEQTRYHAECEGLSSPAGELRCAAQACTSALTQAVKAIRAFDTNVVIVALSTHGEGMPRRVVGSVLTEEDTARAAALAVLNATNRLLSNRLFIP
jgi:hypothetical protein